MHKDRTRQIVIRADAGTRLGIGHVMRCLALAQAWQDADGVASFVVVQLPDTLAARLAVEGIAVEQLDVIRGSHEDATQTAELASRADADWVVVDGYHFGTDYQRMIKASGLRVLAIDDHRHADHDVADLVLNQNIYADASLYHGFEPTTQLLLGTRYALLRREFWRWRGWTRQIPDVARRVLVTLGGGDSDNQTLKVIQALNEITLDNVEAAVVVGGSNPHLSVLQAAVSDAPGAVRLVQNVADMPKLMAWADVAVSAGGSTCWELAFMGLPTILIEAAENQVEIARELERQGCAVNLGWHAQVSAVDISDRLNILIPDSMKRREMSAVAQAMVDGAGAERIVARLVDLDVSPVVPKDGLRLRCANIEDMDLLWQWANEASVRSVSFHPQPIPYEDHVIWYAEKLRSSTTAIWILESEGRPVGQIRYELVADDVAELSFSIAPQSRREGFGTKLLTMSAVLACRSLSVTRLRALTFLTNAGAVRTFQSAGYSAMGQEKRFDRECHVFEWTCCQGGDHRNGVTDID